MPDPHLLIIHTQECPMIFIEAGRFNMGSPDDEQSQHSVTVPDFYLGKYPVTQGLWKAVMNDENPSNFSGDDRPVEQVSWDEAQVFIGKLNALPEAGRPAGYLFSLPTEAEWEYAARGGKYHREGYKYAGSDRLKDVGWFADNSGGETKPVGLKYPNQLGLHDMSGNVWEWCADDWHEKYDEHAPADGSAWIDHPERGLGRVLRGGSWDSSAKYCRVAYRDFGEPGRRGSGVGFRLALVLQSAGRS
jgi:sulfatase modifying factor 1